MATSISNIKKAIMNIISASVDRVKDVSNYEKAHFRGFPAVCVFMSENENDFFSTAENMRSFTFIIRIYELLEDVPISDVSESAKQRAENVLEGVVSQILDEFDKRSNITLNGEIDYLIPLPSSWDIVPTPIGYCRTADIKLICNKIYDVT
jgi:hypothetical protein